MQHAAVPSTTCSRRRMASRHSQQGAAAVFAILTLAACVTSTGASILDATWTLAASHRLSTSRPEVRSLLDTTIDIPTYWIPTTQGSLCQGGNCCDANAEALPYWLQHLNSSSFSVGTKRHTTFFLRLHSDRQGCLAGPSAGDCCNADLAELRLDIDPMLSVDYASVNGRTATFSAQQDKYGMHIVPAPGALSSIPSDGVLLTITVIGDVQELCPTPDFMIGTPASGMCQVIVLGSTLSNGPGSCCSYTLARPASLNNNFVPGLPQCSEALSAGPAAVTLRSVSLPFALPSAGGALASNYTFDVSPQDGCDPTAINQCCDMAYDALELTIAPSVNIVGTASGVAGQGLVPAVAAYHATGNSQVMAIRLGTSGTSSGVTTVVVTVLLPTGTSDVPDLCTASDQTDGSAASLVGGCAYTLRSAATTNSMCCPSSATTPLAPGQNPYPPPPSGTCQPALQVPVTDTSMGFGYYDGPLPLAASSTTFVFIAFNNATCAGQYCQDLCSWQLLVSSSLVPLLASANAGSAFTVQSLSATTSALTFANPPASGGGGTSMYTLSVSRSDVTLDQLCAGTSTSSPSGQPCSAILLNPEVYSVVRFGQGDRLVPSGPTPSPRPSPSPTPEPPACPNPQPLSGSCVRVDTAGFNTPVASSGDSTILDFKVGNHDGESGCTPDEAVMSFRLLLTPSAAAQLRSSNSLVPAQATFGASDDSVVWSWTPVTSGSSLHYQLYLPGTLSPADVCQQGVLPNQPAGSCVVIFSGATACYTGFVAVPRDPTIGPIFPAPVSSTSGSSVAASVIVPAIIVPLVVLVAIGAAVYFIVARRKRFAARNAAMATTADDLAAPLAAASATSQTSSHSIGGGSEQSTGDVLIRLPNSHQPGAQLL